MNENCHCNHLILHGLAQRLEGLYQYQVENFETNSKSVPLFGAPLNLNDNEMTFQTCWNHVVNKNVTSRNEHLIMAVLLH